jgi:hypothetical protein
MDDAEDSGIALQIAPDVIPRVIALSGGHPHILQLLGSYLLEHEDQDPDGIIDSKDLISSLQRVCYQDRAKAYDAAIHMLSVENKLEALQEVLSLAGGRFPTRIPRTTAVDTVGPDVLTWLVDRDVLSVPSSGSAHYGLVDEFLRIRLLLDSEQSEQNKQALEAEIVQAISIEEFVEAELSSENGNAADYPERESTARGEEFDGNDEEGED